MGLRPTHGHENRGLNRMAHFGASTFTAVLRTRFDMAENPNHEKTLSILVADDLPECRRLLQSILQARPNWQVVSEVCDGMEAVQRTAELLPDIVLLDIGMPLLNGIEAAQRIRQVSPSSRIIFVTQNVEGESRTAALAAGAEGYVLKANAARDLHPAIETAMRDGHKV